MSQNDKNWNPTPAPAEAKLCPHCGRKLLTQTSALCNWCGAKIDDPEYQMRAAQERQSLDQVDRQRVAESQKDQPYYGKLRTLLGKADRTPKGNPEPKRS